MGSERENIGGLSLLEVLGRLPDPRSGHGRRHPLGAILGLAVCAMRGARSLYASAVGKGQGERFGDWASPGVVPLVSTLPGISPVGPGPSNCFWVQC